MMTLQEIAKEIGVGNCDALPKELFAYYPIPKERENELCSMQLICRLQERFDFFEEYFETAKRYWLATEKDELRKTWIDVCSLFIKDNEYELATQVLVPEPNGTPEGDFLQLFIYLPVIEDAYTLYVKKGFSEEQVRKYVKSFISTVRHVDKNVLGRPAMNALYFYWECLYAKTRFFNYGCLNFEIHSASLCYVLCNKKTKQTIVLSMGEKVDKNAMVFGSAGVDDEEGAFFTTFEETATHYVGYPSGKYGYKNQKESFSKNDWEIAMQPGDRVIGVHIPRGADLSEQSLSETLNGTKTIVKKYFSECEPKAFVCTSWLLSPQLEEILDGDSKILSFGRRFVRFPKKDEGKSVFNFVFPQNFKGTYDELPEDTRLMRGVKAKYLRGEYVHDYHGVILL